MSDPAQILESTRVETMKRNILRNVYLWMVVGLSITGVFAYVVSQNYVQIMSALGPGVVVLLFAQIGLVIFLNSAMKRLGVMSATLLFALFAILNGVTLSYIFVVYEIGFLAQTFFATAGMYAGAAVFGMVTKRDLSTWGRFLSMAVIGILVALVINLIFQSPMFDLLISLIGVVVFAGLTAYENQKILQVSRYYGDSIDEVNYVRISILGALTLYISFINMFIFLLRIFGGRR